MANAHVTVSTASGRLTPDSTVAVWDGDGRTIDSARVPVKARVGGVLFWPRVAEAIEGIGFRIVPNSTDNDPFDGAVAFDVVSSLS